MIDSHLKTQLEKATLDLDKTADVEGILIVASDGRILHHNLRVDVDINLFGPMSQVISNSSHRLLNSSGQGNLERVLVESNGGKALFLGLDKAHLIILMQDTANVGLILVNAKRASQKIDAATQDLVLEVPEKVPEKAPEEIPTEAPEEIPEKIPAEASEEILAEPSEEIPEEIPTEVPEKILAESTEEIPEEIPENISKEVLDEIPEVSVDETPAEEMVDSREPVAETASEPAGLETEDVETEFTQMGELKEVEVETAPEIIDTKTTPEIPEAKTEISDITPEVPEAETETVEAEPEEVRPSIPTVKPPISFPKLPEHVEVPDDPDKRSDLILDIYEKIFLAMSMGAAKIMGVAPARGLTKKFLPFEKCQRLLQNVDLKSNATLDFAQIRKNATEIPVNEREEIFIRDFSRMIEIITENYGRVMGYEAFRGMVRAEFLAINKSYGDAMEKLNIKQNMHPEIALLFN